MPVAVAMVSAVYAVAGSVNWDTTWWWTAKAPTVLIVAFGTAPTADGAVLDLTLTE